MDNIQLKSTKVEILNVECRRIVENMKVMREKNEGFKNKEIEDNSKFEVLNLRGNAHLLIKVFNT